jgi:glycine cleavage system H protein
VSSPSELKYTKDHEWVRVEGDIAFIGITDHAQDALGDIVFVEVPEIGRDLSKGDEASNIESVKAAAPVYSPVSGSVSEVNLELDGTPELLNQKPHDTFIFAVKLSDPEEVEGLLSYDQYQTFLSEEK